MTREIHIARIYDEEIPAGTRIFVDRLWPRGVKKESANWELWPKEWTPSHELRKRVHADGDWDAFTADYRAELELVEIDLPAGDIVLMTAAKGRPNHCDVLKAYLDARP